MLSRLHGHLLDAQLVLLEARHLLLLLQMLRLPLDRLRRRGHGLSRLLLRFFGFQHPISLSLVRPQGVQLLVPPLAGRLMLQTICGGLRMRDVQQGGLPQELLRVRQELLLLALPARQQVLAARLQQQVLGVPEGKQLICYFYALH